MSSIITAGLLSNTALGSSMMHAFLPAIAAAAAEMEAQPRPVVANGARHRKRKGRSAAVYAGPKLPVVGKARHFKCHADRLKVENGEVEGVKLNIVEIKYQCPAKRKPREEAWRQHRLDGARYKGVLRRRAS